jgi:hypothetical protein
LNQDRFAAWAIVLFFIAVEDVAPEILPRLRWDRVGIEDLDLDDLESVAGRCETRPPPVRHPLAQEIRALARQMTKLFPEFQCLQSVGAAVDAGAPR